MTLGSCIQEQFPVQGSGFGAESASLGNLDDWAFGLGKARDRPQQAKKRVRERSITNEGPRESRCRCGGDAAKDQFYIPKYVRQTHEGTLAAR